MKNQVKKIIFISLLTSNFLFGGTVPNISEIEKQIKTPDIEQKKTTIPQINTHKEYKALMKDNGKTIFVRSFIFTGNEHIDSEILEKYTKDYENKKLTFTEITELTSQITKYYRYKGYFVARAYLPIQDIEQNNGVITISIIEGNYGEFKLKNDSLVKESVVQDMLDNAKNRDNVISTNTLERSMLLINDTPGIVVTQADVKPGSEIGTSDFIITTDKTNRVDGYVLTDNVGSRYTGKNRLMAGVNINSPFNIGDKIAISGLLSNESNLLNGSVAYSAPLASNGLLGEVSYSQTDYNLTKEYKDLDAQGTAKTIDAKLKYPVIRTKEENLYLNMGITSKNLEDKVNSTNDITKKESQSFCIGTDYDKSYMLSKFNSTSKINFNIKYGNLSFNDEEDKLTDETGANTNGTYSKVNLDLSNIIAFTNELSLDASLKIQHALENKNLDGSEDISIGGSTGVKLYPDGEISAENGYVFNTELKYNLPNINNISNNVGLFYDRGKAFMANNTAGFEAKSLQDVGIGYYLSYNKLFGKLQIAWNANSQEITSEPNRNSSVLFQGGISF